MNSNKYEQFVTMVAKNALEQELSPRVTARQSIVYPERVGDEQTLLFGLPSLADDPSSQTRLWPKDVITGTDRDWSSIHTDEIRNLAVEILTRDVYDAMMGIENDTLLGPRA